MKQWPAVSIACWQGPARTAGGHAGRDQQQRHGPAPQAAVHLGCALDEAREEPAEVAVVQEVQADSGDSRSVRGPDLRICARQPLQGSCWAAGHGRAAVKGDGMTGRASRERPAHASRPARLRRCAAAADTSIPSYSTSSSSDEADELTPSVAGLPPLISSTTACPFLTSSTSSSVAAGHVGQGTIDHGSSSAWGAWRWGGD